MSTEQPQNLRETFIKQANAEARLLIEYNGKQGKMVARHIVFMGSDIARLTQGASDVNASDLRVYLQVADEFFGTGVSIFKKEAEQARTILENVINGLNNTPA